MTRLVIEDWMYHVFHLAGNHKDCKDCRVCEWYRKLNEKTKRRNLVKI